MRTLRTFLVIAAAFVSVLGQGSAPVNDLTQTAMRTATSASPRHFIANLGGSTRPARLGFDLFDVGTSTDRINALPPGVKSLIWLGQQCPTRADRSFRRTVRRLARNPRVFGYYLSDEPHVRDCPRGPRALATRARYIREVTEGRQRSFIAINQTSADWRAGYRDTRAFRPSITHVDLIGIVAYPCSVHGCDFTKVGYKVRLARRGGIPLRAIVPVYQAFGQGRAAHGHYYRMPTAAQTRRLLATWRSVVPHPVMDYTYSWRHQRSANPTLIDRPGIQAVFARFFG